jgi:hypothetical protein
MRDENHGHALLMELHDSFLAFVLERYVAHGEHLIEQQNVRIKMSGNRKPQPHVHAR